MVELFQATSDSEDDLPGVTGMPSNRSNNAKPRLYFHEVKNINEVIFKLKFLFIF